MTHFNKFAREFWCNEDGATAIEYGLIVALIALAIIGSLATFSTSNNSVWNVVSREVTGVMAAPGPPAP